MNEAVIKTGGSSLSSAKNVSNVSDIIVEHYINSDEELDVVISAFGAEPKVTDRLLKVADYTFNGNLESAVKEIQGIREIHYSIVDGLRLDRGLVDGYLTELEETVRDSTRRLKQAYYGFSEFLNKALDYIKIKQKLPAQVARFLAVKEKLDDAVAGLGELASTPVVATLVQRKLEEKFKQLEDRLRQSSLSEREQKIYERLKSCNGQYTAVLDSREQGFITDSNFGNATLLDRSLDTEIARHHQSARAKNRNRILFYPGYVARDEYGNQTTLGRDGSNVTAIALAAAIGAKEVIIYSDTDGVLIADPKILGESQTARHLSYHEESLLAKWGGMKALQENSLHILNRKGVSIPIYIRNSFNPREPGTILTPESIGAYYTMKGIGVIPNVSYSEFIVNSFDDYQKIKAILGKYKGVEILWDTFEGIEGRARFLLRRDPPIERTKGKKYFREEIFDKIRAEVHKGADINGDFYYDGASLITICSEGLGNDPLEISKIEEIISGIRMGPDEMLASKLTDAFFGISENTYRFPLIKGRDSIQIVVSAYKVKHIVQALYNQLKRTNIVLYGLGNIGLAFLKKAIEDYDDLRLNVVAVRDTSGTYAKLGGFSVEELKAIVAMKEKGTRIKDMELVHGATYIQDGNFRQVYQMAKGDFVLIDATDDPSMRNTISHALHLGSRVISVNKLPYALQPLPTKDKALDNIVNRNVRKLFEAMFRRQLFMRGTVGANLGVTDTLLDNVLTHNPRYVTVVGSKSGTLGYIDTRMDSGLTFSQTLDEAIELGITESTPFADILGLDVLNKTTILWREIATKFGLDYFNFKPNYESFIEPAVRKYKQKTGKEFDISRLHLLRGKFPEERRELIERMRLPDEAFAELRREIGSEHVLRYVGEIEFDEQTGYSLNVRLKKVHKENPLANLEGRDNMFLFGVDGPPKKPYGIEPGPGAGVEETASAIMHDLEQINTIMREDPWADRTIRYQKYAPERKPKGEKWQPIKWFGPYGPSARALQFLAR